MITIVQQGNRWIAQFPFSYETKDKVKAAGFRFDGAAKCWYTHDPAVAARFADPETAKALRAQHEAAVAASRAVAADVDIPAPDGLTYRPFQRAAIAYAMARPNVLIADEMGLGKTIQAIGIANADPSVRSVLVIAPASLKINWRREWEKWDTKRLSVGIADSSGLPDTDVVIVNYDILGKLRAAIDARPWDLLIVDECHYIKNPKAQRTQAILGSGKSRPAIKARRRVFMTGTPIVNHPIELWPIVQTLDPQGLGKNFMYYAQRYCEAKHNGWGWDFSGVSNLDELQTKLRATVMVRRLKADVLDDLPPKTRQIIEIPANGMASLMQREAAMAQRHETEMMRLHAEAELAKAEGEEAYKAAVSRLRDAARVAFEEMATVRHELALAKVPYLVEHIENCIAPDHKVIVMVWHRDVVEKLMAAFGDRAVQVHGDVSIANRQAAVDRFQSDPRCQIFVGTIKAAGVGLTLTASSHVIFGELWWVPGDITQAEDRCHRIGQRRNVLVQHLVVDGSLDARMAKTIVAKQEIIDRALDRVVDEEPAWPDEKTIDIATKEQSPQDIAKAAKRYGADHIAAVHQALRFLAHLDPDGARQRNDLGFNRYDTRIGQQLAALDTLTPRQAVLGAQIALKYRRQLPEPLVQKIQEVQK